MRLLLVEPASRHQAPNLGLLCLSAALAAGRHHAFLLDLNHHPRPDPAARVAELVAAHGLEVVGFSLCDVNFAFGLELARRLKELGVPARLLAGGPQVNSLGPRVLAEHPEFDLALMGEAEESLMRLLDCLEAGGDPATVPGLCHRRGGGVAAVAPGSPPDPARLPPPDYRHLGIAGLSGYMLLTSRGCPHRCSFCCRNTGSVWRPRSLDACLAELHAAKRALGIRSFRIVDASFNLKEVRVVEFCRRLRAERVDLPWMVSGIRADRLGAATVAALKEAGCLMLAMGVESLDPAVFAGIGKGESLEDITRALALCRRQGLEVGLYMVHGLPGDGYARSIHYARALQDLRPDYVMYNHAIPFPGTALHQWVSRHGHFNPEFSWRDTRSLESVGFWTDDFSEAERLASFRVIQTITQVINFAGGAEERARLLEEIRQNDPAHLDRHLAYLDELAREGDPAAKNRIKHLHQEDRIAWLPGHTGCVDTRTGRPV